MGASFNVLWVTYNLVDCWFAIGTGSGSTVACGSRDLLYIPFVFATSALFVPTLVFPNRALPLASSISMLALLYFLPGLLIITEMDSLRHYVRKDVPGLIVYLAPFLLLMSSSAAILYKQHALRFIWVVIAVGLIGVSAIPIAIANVPSNYYTIDRQEEFAPGPAPR